MLVYAKLVDCIKLDDSCGIVPKLLAPTYIQFSRAVIFCITCGLFRVKPFDCLKFVLVKCFVDTRKYYFIIGLLIKRSQCTRSLPFEYWDKQVVRLVSTNNFANKKTDDTLF